MKPLRILCFNIHGGYDMKRKRDLTRINAFLNRMDIDIAVFQEMETRLSRGGTAQDISMIAGQERPFHLPALTLKEEEGWYGNLIVSRYPILRGLVHDLETSKSLEPRNAVDAVIATPLGDIRIIGTHLSLSPFERWSEIRNLLRLINSVEEEEKKPLFLMGDINEWRPSSRLLRHLDSLLTPIPCKPTFPWFMPCLRLDRAWYSHADFHVKATACKTSPSFLSDHLPVLLEVTKI